MRSVLKPLLRDYAKIEPDILKLISAAFFMQMINAAFFLVLNLYMTKNGYSDSEIANYISYRFLAVMLFAVPFGMFIKGRRLRPVFLLATGCLPIISLVALQAVEAHHTQLLAFLFVLWGLCFSCMYICLLPYMLRNAPKHTHTASISLNAASWSLGQIVAGFVIFSLSGLAPHFFGDKQLLQVFCLIGFGSLFAVLSMNKNEKLSSQKPDLVKHAPQKRGFAHYDWMLIIKPAVPVMLIAVGAGLTIPFMNLFFYHNFGMDSDSFSLLGSVTSCFVASVALMAPAVKNRFGYEAITGTQTLAIIALVGLGSTEFFAEYRLAFYVALFCYIARQPLMNLANPLSSEMSMYYVGKKNEEIMSAITSSIWSGSWFVSAQIFGILRAYHFRYVHIFYITAGFYCIGVVLYFLLIKDFRVRQKAGVV